MSGHDGHGADDLDVGRDVLRQTIDALVSGATPTDVPSAPEENLGLLRRRVRTWRVAKAGVMGLGTAAVVGALAFSAAQASTFTRSEPLPGRPTIEATETGPVPSEIPTPRRSPSPTASVSPSPSETPDVEPSPDASVSSTTGAEPDGTEEPDGPAAAWPPFESFDEGYLPWAFDASPVACGLPIGDLPRDPVRFTIEPNDSPDDLRVTSAFTIREVAGESHQLESGAEPEYLLFQDGRLVSSSVGARDAGYWGEPVDAVEPVSPGQTWQVAKGYTVEIDVISTCGERQENDGVPSLEFSTPLPAGEYEVVYAAPYRLLDTWELAFSEPYPVTIP